MPWLLLIAVLTAVALARRGADASGGVGPVASPLPPPHASVLPSFDFGTIFPSGGLPHFDMPALPPGTFDVCAQMTAATFEQQIYAMVQSASVPGKTPYFKPSTDPRFQRYADCLNQHFKNGADAVVALASCHATIVSVVDGAIRAGDSAAVIVALEGLRDHAMSPVVAVSASAALNCLSGV